MLNLLNILRYFVFVVFLVCNAVISSVAVWNLSIVEAVSSQSKAKRTDGLLIFVGASGLLLIFTVLFFELYGKNVVIGRVWFELVWVALYCILELAGAAAYTALSSSQTCDASSLGASESALSLDACASTQVLQAFTWICATLLLGYFTFLGILTYVKRKDDPTIWHCSVRRFPVLNNHNPKDVPASPAYARFRASADVPVIAAPQPRKAPGTRQPVLSYNSGLSYRSGLGLEYEIEHYQSPESVLHATSTEHHGTVTATSPVQPTSPTRGLSQTFQFPTSAAPIAPSASQLLRPIRPLEPVQPATARQPIVSTPFYHSSVVSAVKDRRTSQPQAPPPAAVRGGGGGGGGSQVRRLPPSPPPLGDWPRLDATSRPSRIKRKPLPRPEPELEPERYEPEVAPEPQRQVSQRSQSQSQSHSHSHTHSHSHSHGQSQSRHERRVLPVPVPTRTLSQSRPQPQPPSQPQPQSQPPQPQPQVQRHARPLPSTQPTMEMPSSPSYPLDASALSAALHPLEVSQSMRSKPSRPSGPRGKSNSIDDGRPIDIDHDLEQLELSRTSRTLHYHDHSSGYS